MAITGLSGIGVSSPFGATGAYKGQQKTGPSFAQQLQNAVQNVEQAQVERDMSVEDMVSGEVIEAHDVMIAAEEAQLTFELMLEVRNKLLESYNQIMQMQV
jgi:flagellar hook-basal body complex protein FliE